MIFQEISTLEQPDMDTKRCTHCQKLQRADAVLCNRCGRHFIKAPSSSQPGSSTLSTVSILPSSPHRAGHYSGLHPEDLPYFSSKITVQRPPLPTKQPEPEHIILPESHTDNLDPLDGITLFSKSFVTTITERLPVVPRQFHARRALSAVIIGTCILMLLAGSLLTFTLINNQAPMTVFSQTVTATPQLVHLNETFQLNGSGFGKQNLITVKDDLDRSLLDMQGNPLVIHADSQGTFSVEIRVPPTWQRGTHTIYIIDETIQQNFSTMITLA